MAEGVLVFSLFYACIFIFLGRKNTIITSPMDNGKFCVFNRITCFAKSTFHNPPKQSVMQSTAATSPCRILGSDGPQYPHSPPPSPSARLSVSI